MTVESPGDSTPAVTPPGKTPFERIAGVLFDPAETFEDIARKPDVLVVLLLIVVISYASVAITMPRLDFDAMFAAQAEQMRSRNSSISEADLERTQRWTMGFAKVMSWTAPVLMVAWYAIVAGVLLLTFRLFGGEGTYRQAFSAAVYSWLPLVLFSIISTIVILARGTYDPTTSATLVMSNPAFLADMKESPILYSLLSSFDVFTIWTLILLTFAFAALSKSPRARSAVIVFSLWLVTVVIKLGFAAMGAVGTKS